MLLFLVITAIIIAGLAVVFALQNADPVSVGFLFWSFEASLALVLLLTFAMGAIASLSALLYWMMQKGRMKRKKENSSRDTV